MRQNYLVKKTFFSLFEDRTDVTIYYDGEKVCEKQLAHYPTGATTGYDRIYMEANSKIAVAGMGIMRRVMDAAEIRELYDWMRPSG